MVNKFPLIILFFISSISFTQPSIAWQRCYGTFDGDSFQDAILTSDGGVAATLHYGGYDGDAIGLYDLSYPAILAKFDTNLDIEWQKFFGGTTNTSGFYRLSELTDFGFICGGATYALDSDFISNHGSWDLMLVRTDKFGNKFWSKCYGSPGVEEFESLIKTNDNGYLLTGRSFSSGGNIPFHFGDGTTTDAIIFKIDSIGNIEWTKVLGGSLNDSPDGNPVEVENGQYIININSFSDDHDLADSDISGHKRWIIKLDSLGSIIQSNIISADSDLYILSNQDYIINNEGLIVHAGYANPETNLFPGVNGIGGSFDAAVSIFDKDLNFIDMKIYGGTASDIFYKIKMDEFGNYYVLGVSSSDDFNLPDNYGPGYDYWILKLDHNFNVIWSKNFGGSNSCGDLACSSFLGDFVIKDNMLYIFVRAVVPDVLPDYDIACGHVNLSEDLDTDAWLVAFDLTTDIPDIDIKTNEFLVFVNSDNSNIIVQNNSNNTKIESIAFYNTSGSCVFKNNYSIENSIEIPTNEFSTGLYFVIISDNYSTRFISKVVIQH